MNLNNLVIRKQKYKTNQIPRKMNHVQNIPVQNDSYPHFVCVFHSAFISKTASESFYLKIIIIYVYEE